LYPCSIDVGKSGAQHAALDIQTQSATIAAIILLALGINLGLQERRVEHRGAFIGLLTAFFFYNLSFVLYQANAGGFFTRMLMFSGAGVAQASVRFFSRYLEAPMATARLITNASTVAVAVLGITRFGESAFLGVAVAGLAVGAYGYGIFRLYQRYREAQGGVEVRRLSYLVFGGVVSVGFSTLDLLPAAGLPFPAFGHLLTCVYLYFWTQVIQRSRLLDLRELLGRGLAMLVQSVVVWVILLALLVWVGDKIGLLLFNTLLAGVVLYFTFEPITTLIERWIGRVLFRDTALLRAQLSGLRQDLAKVIHMGDLVDRVLDRLQASRRVTHASIYLLESNASAFYSLRSIGTLGSERINVVEGRAFFDALTREKMLSFEGIDGDLFDLEDGTGRTPERERLVAIRQTMIEMSSGYSFAVLAKDRLVGVLNIQDDRTREAFSSTEIEMLASLTMQISTVLENSELFEQLKERDRLQVMGEMAAGMAHEIRNPLGAIKAAGQLLEPETLGEEQREFVEVIIEESDRLNHVLSQFLEYARPYRGSLQACSLVPVLERVRTLLAANAPDITVDLSMADPLPQIIGDADQLVQVCLNLGRNAVDAMQDAQETDGALFLAARVISIGAETRVEVEVRDTGPGIPPEVRRQLFVPFFTTKKSGTGLGLAICQRILQHHDAKIRVHSTLNEGTRMSFALPVADPEHRLSGEHRRRLTADSL
jgi:two-component system sensor histidine kinase HydH